MIYQVVIPTLLLFMPWVLVRYVFATGQTRTLPYKRHAVYMWLAAGFWVLSQVLPNVPVSPETNTFTMHTLGGVVAAILFIYAIKCYKLSFAAWWQPWVGLFLFASGLGVLNELFEFFLKAVGYFGVVDGDEWWDLTANTLGAFAAFFLMELAKGRTRFYNLATYDNKSNQLRK